MSGKYISLIFLLLVAFLAGCQGENGNSRRSGSQPQKFDHEGSVTPLMDALDEKLTASLTSKEQKLEKTNKKLRDAQRAVQEQLQEHERLRNEQLKVKVNEALSKAAKAEVDYLEKRKAHLKQDLTLLQEKRRDTHQKSDSDKHRHDLSDTGHLGSSTKQMTMNRAPTAPITHDQESERTNETSDRDTRLKQNLRTELLQIARKDGSGLVELEKLNSRLALVRRRARARGLCGQFYYPQHSRRLKVEIFYDIPEHTCYYRVFERQPIH